MRPSPRKSRTLRQTRHRRPQGRGRRVGGAGRAFRRRSASRLLPFVELLEFRLREVRRRLENLILDEIGVEVLHEVAILVPPFRRLPAELPPRSWFPRFEDCRADSLPELGEPQLRRL